LQRLEGHTGYINSVALSADSRTVVSGSKDKTLRIWSVESGGCLLKLSAASAVLSVALSWDGSTVVSGSEDKVLRVWSAIDGTCLHRFPDAHSGYVHAASVSSNGRTIVTGGSDKAVRLWAISREWHGHHDTEGHVGRISCAALSPDGRMLLSAGHDRTVRNWSTSSGISIQTLEGHGSPVATVAVSDTGRRLLTRDEDDSALRWVMADEGDQYASVGVSQFGPETGLSPADVLSRPPQFVPQLAARVCVYAVNGSRLRVVIDPVVEGREEESSSLALAESVDQWQDVIEPSLHASAEELPGCVTFRLMRGRLPLPSGSSSSSSSSSEPGSRKEEAEAADDAADDEDVEKAFPATATSAG
jgi:WD40 repeat protein